MNKRTWIEIGAAGLVAAIAIPAVAFGNSRPNPAAATNTPYVAALNGPNEITATTLTADPDGVGGAAFTFDLSAATPNVCWDLSYSAIEQPTMAHIHSGAAGVDGPIVITVQPGIARGDVGNRMLESHRAGADGRRTRSSPTRPTSTSTSTTSRTPRARSAGN